MATVIPGRGIRGAEGWLSTFRAGDAWVVAVWEASSALAPGTGELARQMRRGALRCGCALVAAAQCGPGEHRRAYVERAHGSLMEARYLLYLAKRLGSLDSRRYKSLTTRLDRAVREISSRRLS